MQKNNKKTRVDEMSTMRANIAFFRHSRNLKQSELAEMTGLQKAYISQIETGFRIPTLATLAKIAEALDTSMADLLTPKNS